METNHVVNYQLIDFLRALQLVSEPYALKTAR